MNIELLNELLKKSGQVDFWINKDVYSFYNLFTGGMV